MGKISSHQLLQAFENSILTNKVKYATEMPLWEKNSLSNFPHSVLHLPFLKPHKFHEACMFFKSTNREYLATGYACIGRYKVGGRENGVMFDVKSVWC